MTWEGKTLGEICNQIKDPSRNGGRSLGDLVHHIGMHTLVGRAWAPGFGRHLAPGTQKEAGAGRSLGRNRGSLSEVACAAGRSLARRSFEPQPERRHVTSVLATARLFTSGPKSLASSMARISASRLRARLTRLLMVPTAQPQICAASS